MRRIPRRRPGKKPTRMAGMGNLVQVWVSGRGMAVDEEDDGVVVGEEVGFDVLVLVGDDEVRNPGGGVD